MMRLLQFERGVPGGMVRRLAAGSFVFTILVASPGSAGAPGLAAAPTTIAAPRATSASLPAAAVLVIRGVLLVLRAAP